MFSLSLKICKLAQDFRCDVPRARVSGAGGVICRLRRAGDRHADSSTGPTKANAQCGKRLAASLETETGLARIKKG
jgi:hypothetical protein